MAAEFISYSILETSATNPLVRSIPNATEKQLTRLHSSEPFNTNSGQTATLDYDNTTKLFFRFPKYGADFLSSVTMSLDLPALYKNENSALADHHILYGWCDYIGLACIKNVTVKLNGRKINQFDSSYIFSYYRRSLIHDKWKEFEDLVGHVDELTKAQVWHLLLHVDDLQGPAFPAKRVHIPLPLIPGSNIPLLYMEELTLEVELAPIKELIMSFDPVQQFNAGPGRENTIIKTGTQFVVTRVPGLMYSFNRGQYIDFASEKKDFLSSVDQERVTLSGTGITVPAQLHIETYRELRLRPVSIPGQLMTHRVETITAQTDRSARTVVVNIPSQYVIKQMYIFAQDSITRKMNRTFDYCSVDSRLFEQFAIETAATRNAVAGSFRILDSETFDPETFDPETFDPEVVTKYVIPPLNPGKDTIDSMIADVGDLTALFAEWQKLRRDSRTHFSNIIESAQLTVNNQPIIAGTLDSDLDRLHSFYHREAGRLQRDGIIAYSFSNSPETNLPAGFLCVNNISTGPAGFQLTLTLTKRPPKVLDLDSTVFITVYLEVYQTILFNTPNSLPTIYPDDVRPPYNT